jgi:hypothetical protein
MMDCENLKLVGKDPVDDTVALHNDFPNVLSTNLWDNTT